MHSIDQYQDFFSSYLKQQNFSREPQNLYDPIDYILSLGGKRIRPVLTLMAAEIFDADYKKALPAAMAIELFHNFSLIHDDIMDKAPLRRGKETVHKKWNTNIGILSGDATLVLAYQYFEQFEPTIFLALSKLFSKMALQVCEGQQLDLDFESFEKPSISEYIKMIKNKTAVLLATALEVGAIVAGASEANRLLIYDFGLYLGIAFQLQDDYLDVFGDPKNFGKQIGGDIIENKKTYLYLKALQNADQETANQLLNWYTVQTSENTDKICSVKHIFNITGASEATQKAVQQYISKAFETLEQMDIKKEKKEHLKAFGNYLMRRNV